MHLTMRFLSISKEVMGKIAFKLMWQPQTFYFYYYLCLILRQLMPPIRKASILKNIQPFSVLVTLLPGNSHEYVQMDITC